MIRRKITLGDPQEERKIIQDLMARYHQLMATRRNHDRVTGKSVAREADQLRQEALRRIGRLPEGLMKEHLTRKLYEG
jgi:hypothetical protein